MARFRIKPLEINSFKRFFRFPEIVCFCLLLGICPQFAPISGGVVF